MEPCRTALRWTGAGARTCGSGKPPSLPGGQITLYFPPPIWHPCPTLLFHGNPGPTFPPMVRIPPPACAGRNGGLVPDAPGMVPDAMGNSRHAVRISPCPASAALAHSPGLFPSGAGDAAVQPLGHPGQVCGAYLVHGFHHVHGHPHADLHHRRFCGQCGGPDEPGFPPWRAPSAST